MTYCLGKTPARPGSIKYRFSRYFDKSALPTPPRRFGHFGAVKDWGMFANDKYSDCVWAGAAHETMLWNTANKRSVSISTKNVLSDYAAATGFDPRKENTDQGTDMQTAAEYRRKIGIIDEAGVRHKIDAYVSINAGDIEELALATYLFGVIGVGIVFPSSAMEQFEAQQPWDVVPGARVSGGHYIPAVGRNSANNLLIVSWARLHAGTDNYWKAYCDEAVAYLSLEWLDTNTMLSPDNFDRASLVRDLGLLAA